MIISRRRCDCKIISLVPVPFCVNTVQRKRHNCQHVCRNGRLGPCGINLAGCHIFNIIPVRNVVISCSRIRRNTVMDHHRLWNNHPRQNDFSTLCHRFDLALCDFRWKCSVERMIRNYDILFPLTLRICQRYHPNSLDRRRVRKNFCARDYHRFESWCSNPHRIFSIWPNIVSWRQTQLHRRSIQCHIFCLTRTVGYNLLQDLIRFFCS